MSLDVYLELGGRGCMTCGGYLIHEAKACPFNRADCPVFGANSYAHRSTAGTTFYATSTRAPKKGKSP